MIKLVVVGTSAVLRHGVSSEFAKSKQKMNCLSMTIGKVMEAKKHLNLRVVHQTADTAKPKTVHLHAQQKCHLTEIFFLWHRSHI